tara:strand:+ start:223 stop:423 length:201 start_codon:yes stop_codon:yes gene_type:complete
MKTIQITQPELAKITNDFSKMVLKDLYKNIKKDAYDGTVHLEQIKHRFGNARETMKNVERQAKQSG